MVDYIIYIDSEIYKNPKTIIKHFFKTGIKFVLSFSSTNNSPTTYSFNLPRHFNVSK